MTVNSVLMARLGYRMAPQEVRSRFGGTWFLAEQGAMSVTDRECIYTLPTEAMVNYRVLTPVPLDTVRRIPSKSRKFALYADAEPTSGTITHTTIKNASESNIEAIPGILIGYGTQQECYWFSKIISGSNWYLSMVFYCLELIHGEAPLTQWGGVIWDLLESSSLDSITEDDAKTLKFLDPTIDHSSPGGRLGWMTPEQYDKWVTYTAKRSNRVLDSALPEKGKEICAPLLESNYSGAPLELVIDTLEFAKK